MGYIEKLEPVWSLPKNSYRDGLIMGIQEGSSGVICFDEFGDDCAYNRGYLKGQRVAYGDLGNEEGYEDDPIPF